MEIFEDEEFESSDEVLKVAQEKFGIKYLFPWQRLVIGNIIDVARDAQNGTLLELKEEFKNEDDLLDAYCLGKQIILLPTGAGKSLCFLVPAAMLNGPTLIFYPLLALMADQERRIKSAGLDVVTFKGGQSCNEREENFTRLKNGAKVIIANPEVMQDSQLVERLKSCNIAHIVIDEAHCTSEWGDTFRPAYLTLGNIIKELGINLVSAFTATASPSVLQRISEVLFEGSAHLVRGDTDRPNIHYYVKQTWAKKITALKLAQTEKKPMIIFCGTRRKAEDMARELCEYVGHEKVRFYHAGLEREERTEIEKWFFPKDDAILCSTCAFGMGVDKDNVRTVIHLEASLTAESYIQEAGRGGRDKKDAKAILLWSHEDSKKFGAFEEGTRERVIKKFAEATTCRRQILLDALGGEQVVCSGCDVCEEQNKRESAATTKRNGKEKTLKATDANDVFNFIRKNKNFYSKNAAMEKIKDAFNARDRKIFGMNIWTTSDINEICTFLYSEKLIKNANFLWKHNLTINNKKIRKSIKVKKSNKSAELVTTEIQKDLEPKKTLTTFLPSPKSRLFRSFLAQARLLQEKRVLEHEPFLGARAFSDNVQQNKQSSNKG